MFGENATDQGAHRGDEKRSHTEKVDLNPSGTVDTSGRNNHNHPPAPLDMSGSLGPLTASSRSMRNVTTSRFATAAEDSQDISMDALGEVALSHSQFSIRNLAERKRKQLGSTAKSISAGDIFADSVILSKEDAEVLMVLYGMVILFSRNTIFYLVDALFYATFFYEAASLQVAILYCFAPAQFRCRF